jgi:hypothetical protein
MPPMFNVAAIKYVAKGIYTISKIRVGGSLASNLAWLILFIAAGLFEWILRHAWAEVPLEASTPDCGTGQTLPES